MARLAGRAEQFRMSNEGLVVQRIYDVAEAEGGAVLSGWPDVLASVTQWLGADKANTFLVDARGAVLETTTHEVDDGAQRVYHQHYQAIDPRFELAKGSVDIVHSDVRSLDWKAFERTEIFNDYLRRFGVEYSMFVNLRFAPGKLAPQAFFRPRDAKPFGAADSRRCCRTCLVRCGCVSCCSRRECSGVICSACSTRCRCRSVCSMMLVVWCVSAPGRRRASRSRRC